MSSSLALHLGVKTDPIEYRYSFRWLFRLLSEEGVFRVQLGTFFELYHLPDEYFRELKNTAHEFNVVIESIFTAHRELGGFFINHPAWIAQAFKNYRRLIEVGSLLGAQRVGSNPGAILRDCMDVKEQGIRCYLDHMKQLMRYARDRGIQWLTIEPMSSLAEPPTLPEELRTMVADLMDYHLAFPDETAPVGFCFDVSHGFVDREGVVQYSNIDLLHIVMPDLVEIHLKNTDSMFHSTFGFSDRERSRGIVNVPEIVSVLKSNSKEIPVSELTGYLEIPGPKLGRDYSDVALEGALRESLKYLKDVFC